MLGHRGNASEESPGLCNTQRGEGQYQLGRRQTSYPKDLRSSTSHRRAMMYLDRSCRDTQKLSLGEPLQSDGGRALFEVGFAKQKPCKLHKPADATLSAVEP